jgi:uncharacterized protein (UPF0218 family)
MAGKGNAVIYGLFDRGMCVIRIDDEIREEARRLLKKITSPG